MSQRAVYINPVSPTPVYEGDVILFRNMVKGMIMDKVERVQITSDKGHKTEISVHVLDSLLRRRFPE